MNGFPVKKSILSIFISFILVLNGSCTLLTKTIDSKTKFSENLRKTETHIRNDEWSDAEATISVLDKTWKKVKPLLQVDIDHDYVYNIEENLVKLQGFTETKSKDNSLSTVLLLKDTWRNIGSF